MSDSLYEVAADPNAYARSLRDAGKKIIGFFCTYAPEEIILASGCHPMRLFGAPAGASLADAHLQAYCCCVVKGGLEEGLSGRLDFLYGIVFPHTCDSMQRLSDIWRRNINTKFFADIVLPVKLNTESSREYTIDVLRRFRRGLETALGVKITDGDIEGSIRKYNIIRKNLKDIYDMRSREPGLLSSVDLHGILKASMIFDRDRLIEELPRLADEIRQGACKYDTGSRKRLLFSGSVCNQPDIYTLIEDAGGTVVGDDLCTGARYFEGLIREAGDPIEAIADRYHKRPVCPAKHVSLTARADNLLKMAEESKADGVIFLLLKFCDPHAFDYPYIKETLDKKNIPSILIEIDGSSFSEGQMRTRFETFMEML